MTEQGRSGRIFAKGMIVAIWLGAGAIVDGFVALISAAMVFGKS